MRRSLSILAVTVMASAWVSAAGAADVAVALLGKPDSVVAPCAPEPGPWAPDVVANVPADHEKIPTEDPGAHAPGRWLGEAWTSTLRMVGLAPAKPPRHGKAAAQQRHGSPRTAARNGQSGVEQVGHWKESAAGAR